MALQAPKIWAKAYDLWDRERRPKGCTAKQRMCIAKSRHLLHPQGDSPYSRNSPYWTPDFWNTPKPRIMQARKPTAMLVQPCRMLTCSYAAHVLAREMS